jgi:hypothetical protein
MDRIELSNPVRARVQQMSRFECLPGCLDVTLNRTFLRVAGSRFDQLGEGLDGRPELRTVQSGTASHCKDGLRQSCSVNLEVVYYLGRPRGRGIT